MAKPFEFAHNAWTYCATTTFGMVVFAILYFQKPNNPIASKENPGKETIVTNVVVKEVTNEVEKIVHVPAEIPADYNKAKVLSDKIANAEVVKSGKVLFGMRSICPRVVMDEDVKKVVDQDEIRGLFELVLRQNSVPVDYESANNVNLTINGYLAKSSPILIYNTTVNVSEQQLVFRNEDCKKSVVTVWSKGGFFGTTPKNLAREEILKSVQEDARIFAMDYQSANRRE